MVYSAAKRNRFLSLEWAKTPDVGLPKPDVVVFLDLEPAEAEKRGGYGEEKYEKKEMQMRVRELFLQLLRMDGDEAQMKVVNAGKSIEAVGDEILKEVSATLISVTQGEKGTELGKVKAW
jgi:dTMP kinase